MALTKPKKLAARSKIQQKMAGIEALRFALPVAQYLKVLQDAAFTGELPILDRHGNYSGTSQELNAKERIDLLKYMTNKSLPDRAPTPEQLGREEILSAIDVSIETVEEMTDEQIRRLLATDLETAVVESVSESESQEHSS